MKILSYVLTCDTGFAPNPFHGFLTLATCKPNIRKSAKINDVLVGTGSAQSIGNDKLIYAGVISEVVSIEEYFENKKYAVKKTKLDGGLPEKCGDNIYQKIDGMWKQSPNENHFEEDMERDINGKNVLVCNKFWYFGKFAIDIPPEYSEIIKKGPGHKGVTDTALTNRFMKWIASYKKGMHVEPVHKNSNCSASCEA